MFHLEEYVGLPITHGASFRKYLKEKFTTKVNLKAAHFVEGTEENIKPLSRDELTAVFTGVFSPENFLDWISRLPIPSDNVRIKVEVTRE